MLRDRIKQAIRMQRGLQVSMSRSDLTYLHAFLRDAEMFHNDPEYWKSVGLAAREAGLDELASAALQHRANLDLHRSGRKPEADPMPPILQHAYEWAGHPVGTWEDEMRRFGHPVPSQADHRYNPDLDPVAKFFEEIGEPDEAKRWRDTDPNNPQRRTDHRYNPDLAKPQADPDPNNPWVRWAQRLDIRHNPVLDEFFNEPPAPPRHEPERDPRHNPELDAAFGETAPEPKEPPFAWTAPKGAKTTGTAYRPEEGVPGPPPGTPERTFVPSGPPPLPRKPFASTGPVSGPPTGTPERPYASATVRPTSPAPTPMPPSPRQEAIGWTPRRIPTAMPIGLPIATPIAKRPPRTYDLTGHDFDVDEHGVHTPRVRTMDLSQHDWQPHEGHWIPIAKPLSRAFKRAIRMSRGLPVKLGPADSMSIFRNLAANPRDRALWGILADSLDDDGLGGWASVARALHHGMIENKWDISSKIASAYHPGFFDAKRLTEYYNSGYNPGDSSDKNFHPFRPITYSDSTFGRIHGISVNVSKDPSMSNRDQFLTAIFHVDPVYDNKGDLNGGKGNLIKSGYSIGKVTIPNELEHLLVSEMNDVKSTRFPKRQLPRRMSRTGSVKLSADDHDAFTRSILSNEHDRAPRLIYADWLDENGYPAAAHAMRQSTLPFKMRRPMSHHMLHPMGTGSEYSSTYYGHHLGNPKLGMHLIVHQRPGGKRYVSMTPNLDGYWFLGHDTDDPNHIESILQEFPPAPQTDIKSDSVRAAMGMPRAEQMSRAKPIRLSADIHGMLEAVRNNNMDKGLWGMFSDALDDSGYSGAAEASRTIFHNGEPYWRYDTTGLHGNLFLGVHPEYSGDPSSRHISGGVSLQYPGRLAIHLIRQPKGWLVEFHHNKAGVPFYSGRFGESFVPYRVGANILHESQPLNDPKLHEHMKQQYPLGDGPAERMSRGRPVRNSRHDIAPLWEAIKTNPNDVAGWGIIADALDESDKPHTAALMRQIVGKINAGYHPFEFSTKFDQQFLPKRNMESFSPGAIGHVHGIIMQVWPLRSLLESESGLHGFGVQALRPMPERLSACAFNTFVPVEHGIEIVREMETHPVIRRHWSHAEPQRALEAWGWGQHNHQLHRGRPVRNSMQPPQPGHFFGWISPEGQRHEMAPDDHHGLWANRHLGLPGDSIEAFDKLHDAGWVRVSPPGRLSPHHLVSSGSLRPARVRRNIQEFLRTLNPTDKVSVGSTDQAGVIHGTPEHAIHKLEYYDPRGPLMNRGEPLRMGRHDTPDIMRAVYNNPHDEALWGAVADSLDDDGKVHTAALMRHVMQHGINTRYINIRTPTRLVNVTESVPHFVGDGQSGHVHGIHMMLRHTDNGTSYFNIRRGHPQRWDGPSFGYIPTSVAEGVVSEFDPDQSAEQMSRHGDPIRMSMGGHEPFHHAMAQNPDDQAHRLIYADYLDENDHPDLARAFRHTTHPYDAHIPEEIHMNDNPMVVHGDRLNHEFGRWFNGVHAELPNINVSIQAYRTNPRIAGVALYHDNDQNRLYSLSDLTHLGHYYTTDMEHVNSLLNHLEPRDEESLSLGGIRRMLGVNGARQQVILRFDRFGNPMLEHEDGRDLLFQDDHDHADLARNFGFDDDDNSMAYQFLRHHDGETIDDPGYFSDTPHQMSREPGVQFRRPLRNRMMQAIRDRLRGGKADKIPPSSFDQGKVAEGAKVEREHTDNPAIAAEIARDHLSEDKDYYSKLQTIEGSHK